MIILRVSNNSSNNNTSKYHFSKQYLKHIKHIILPSPKITLERCAFINASLLIR